MATTVHVDPGSDDERIRAARLAAAYEHLEAVLETVDLETDQETATAVIDAIQATDEAYRVGTPGEDYLIAVGTTDA